MFIPDWRDLLPDEAGSTNIHLFICLLVLAFPLRTRLESQFQIALTDVPIVTYARNSFLLGKNVEDAS